jgi:hypothetical protein
MSIGGVSRSMPTRRSGGTVPPPMKTLVNRTWSTPHQLVQAADPVVILPFVSGPKTDTYYEWDPRFPNLLYGPNAQEATRATGVLTS